MTTLALPYFFKEAELASTAKQAGAREKALSFSLDDLKWLSTVYLATHTTRKNHTSPMLVHRLLLMQNGEKGTPLAGAFAMSRPDDGEVVLYTPWQGLIKFKKMDEVKSKLLEWLGQETGRQELMRFLSIEQRSRLPATITPGITTQEIEGSVFQDQETVLERNQAQNLKTLMGELLKMPTLQSMLDEALKASHILLKSFPTLDQRLTRLQTYVRNRSAVAEKDKLRETSSLSLSQALLHYHLKGWPAGDVRVFSNPEHSFSTSGDNQAWEIAVEEIANSLTSQLDNLLETYWNTTTSHGLSRLALFAECLRDTFYTRLLLKRQHGDLSTQEYQALTGASHMSAESTFLAKTVRITTPANSYTDLASTLILGSSSSRGFIYTQHKGIEPTKDVPTVTNTLLERLKSETHEDALLNLMSFAERGRFIAMAPGDRDIVGQPITGSVFEQLMSDILGKQRDNVSHALGLYRDSEDTLDPYVLLDQALDVRGLIDNGMLAVDAEDHASQHMNSRWYAQPATVGGESAKAQLKKIALARKTLDQHLDAHPVIASTIRTVAEAEAAVATSIATLKSSFTQTLSTALRSELDLRTVTRTLGAAEQAIIKAVLDKPVRSQRAKLNGFVPDVFSLALNVGDATVPLKLASCFALTEKGGLDPAKSGKTVLWTPASGFEAFTGLTPLLKALEKRLADKVLHNTLLENLGASERLPGKTCTLAPMQLIDTHFLEHVQQSFVHLDTTRVADALASPLPSAALAELMARVALRAPQTGLQRVTQMAEGLNTRQKLPAWLAKASIADQKLHCELLQQYLNNVTDDQDYLSGISSLQHTARQHLQKQLKADTYDFDPDDIEIRINDAKTAQVMRQTLTEFALIHFTDLDKTRFKLMSLTSTAVPAGMNEQYIKNLIKNLKLGEHQQKTVKDAFAQTQADSADRRKRFYTQVPWQLMHYAHEQKLQGKLSQTGFELIQQIADLPDAIARAAVVGAHAIIRPLELVGVENTPAMTVPHVYLIGSSSDKAATQILIAPHSSGHGIKEYQNEAQLLTELKSGGGLIDWVLMNLPQTDRALLEKEIGSTGKRLADVTLAFNPIKGHLFKRLFNDTADALTRLLGFQADDKKQSAWATIKHVLGEGLHAAFNFFAGKLAYPLTVWRSYQRIKQSAEDLQLHRWGPALKEFINGMAQLATLRDSQDVQSTPSSAPVVAASTPSTTPFKWQDINITAPERTHLSIHESIDIDLGSLTHDVKLGLYEHPSTKKHYCPAQGKVYPVTKHGTRWRIGGDKKRGPYVNRNVSGQWTVDRKTTHPRFSIFDRLRTTFTVWDGMNVDATGMSEIRMLFPEKARQITEALDLATTYAWNSFRNLQMLKDSGDTVTPVHQLIKDFIGVTTVLPEHVELLEQAVSNVFATLLEPSLTKETSSRFVVGRAVSGETNTFAFTVPSDIKRKIYLVNRFFKPAYDVYQPYLSNPDFPINTHARAATLVHEVAHIALDAEDITYLDSGRPFVDLIDTSSPTARGLKEELSKLQETALSVKTPYTDLFTLYDPATGDRDDLGNTFEEDTGDVKKLVLTLTKTVNLSGARTQFKKNALIRLKVLLANADSVAWLITRLGRQLHVSTP
ncbi:MAG: hypothetical protein I8H93_13325 [Pseudomonadales bacterium]|nr:hypothetical protein [Pseudomonadales bacterium]MBH2076974.1 hypothetical protein [Pseudomonadales bacterium]